MKTKLFVTLAVLIYTAVMTLFGGSCIFLELTGIECLGCGMTRALISAFRLDFAAAFSYHKMFWSLPFLYACFLRDGRLFRSKGLNVAFYILIAFGFVFNWAIKYCHIV